MGVGLVVTLVLGVEVRLAVGLRVTLTVGRGVTLAVGLGLGVAAGLAVVVAVGVVVAASARTCAGPNVVRARAIETTVTTETAGDATMARTRARRAMSLFLHFTGSSLACLLSNS